MEKKLLKWTRSVSVHIALVDEQHKHLFQLVNDSYKVVNSKKRNNLDILRIINDLVELSKEHFNTEEFYFKKWKYPGAKEHILQHASLLIEVLKFKDKVLDGNDVVEDLFIFLKGWWENHLKISDHNYYLYFSEHHYVK